LYRPILPGFNHPYTENHRPPSLALPHCAIAQRTKRRHARLLAHFFAIPTSAWRLARKTFLPAIQTN